MPKIFEAVIDGSEETVAVTMPDPLRSARMFKALSDALWAQRSKRGKAPMSSVYSALSAPQAQDAVTSVLGELQSSYIFDAAKHIVTTNLTRDSIDEAADQINFAAPRRALLQTGVWDRFNTRHAITQGNQRFVAVFPRESAPYHRGLSLSMEYGLPVQGVSVVYGLQRQELSQDQTIPLDVTIEYPDESSDGLERHVLRSIPLNEQQEENLLETFQRIGGIVLPEYK